MSLRLRPIDLHLQGRRNSGNADLTVEPREQVAGHVGGLDGSGFDNSGLGHFSLVTQENTHHHAVNTQ
jgi:hypothetical protein